MTAAFTHDGNSRNPVASVTARAIYAFRELYADTPSLANKLVVVPRTLNAFGVPRGYIERNPVNDVLPLPLVDIELPMIR